MAEERASEPVSLLIGEAGQRERGYGRSAVRQMVSHAWEGLGPRRLYVCVLATIAAAIRTYEKTGFTLEGKRRRHALKCGRFADVLIMGLCFEGPS